MYKSILRPWLFRMDAEKIHGQIVALLHVYRHFPPVKCLLRAFYRPKATPFQWRNLTFANRVGLSAGSGNRYSGKGSRKSFPPNLPFAGGSCAGFTYGLQ